jgi:hypothetical protein
MVPSVQILSTGDVYLQFPKVYNLTTVPATNSSFTLVNNYTVYYTLPQILQNISYTFVVPSITNPSIIGSSGLFAVYTYKNGLLIEQNLTAGMVGLAST